LVQHLDESNHAGHAHWAEIVAEAIALELRLKASKDFAVEEGIVPLQDVQLVDDDRVEGWCAGSRVVHVVEQKEIGDIQAHRINPAS
jgi:hypothetical protein